MGEQQPLLSLKIQGWTRRGAAPEGHGPGCCSDIVSWSGDVCPVCPEGETGVGRSWNPEIVWVARDLRDCLVPPPSVPGCSKPCPGPFQGSRASPSCSVPASLCLRGVLK